MITAEILVFDRELPDQMLVLRREATKARGRGFSKWLANHDLSRFLVVVTLKASETDDQDEPYIVNAANEAELGLVIAQQFVEARGGSLAINAGVTQQTRANIDRLINELRELERTPDAGTPAA